MVVVSMVWCDVGLDADSTIAALESLQTPQSAVAQNSFHIEVDLFRNARASS